MRQLNKYRMKKLALVVILLMCSMLYVNAQSLKKHSLKDDTSYIYLPYRIEKGDTIFIDKMNAIYVYPKPVKKKKQSKEWRTYYKTVYNFDKVYGYALKAAEIIREADNTIASTKMNSREKEKYLSAFQKKLFKEFEKPLKNLSISQGKLLLKLIEREAGITSYYLIRDYRGRVAAGFWQGVAKLFGSSLRKPYDKYGEDKLVEDLIQMYNDGRFYYLYLSVFGRSPQGYKYVKKKRV